MNSLWHNRHTFVIFMVVLTLTSQTKTLLVINIIIIIISSSSIIIIITRLAQSTRGKDEPNPVLCSVIQLASPTLPTHSLCSWWNVVQVCS